MPSAQGVAEEPAKPSLRSVPGLICTDLFHWSQVPDAMLEMMMI